MVAVAVAPPVAPPACAAEAVAMARAGLAWLARTDAASLPGAVQAGLLRELEAAEAAHTAARARVLAAFTAQAVYEDDGCRSPVTWLAWQTRITRPAAGGVIGWMRRLIAHPLVAAAMGDGVLSASWARQVCQWTDRLPEEHRGDADRILVAAAANGADLADLAGLAEQIAERCARPDGDDGDDGFTQRGVRLDLHYRGAGHLIGNLTPECAAAVTAVLDSLSKRTGPEDDRTAAQRRHDALEEACRRLVGAGGLPDVAGQPVQIQLHMTLDQLRGLPGAPGAEKAWAAGQAAADGQPGWLRNSAVAGYACDAKLAPLVTGRVDPAALAAMAEAYLAGEHDSGRFTPHRPPHGQPILLSPRSARRLQNTLLAYAADVLSGPAGLASFLRTGLATADFPASVSLPLDVGAAVSTVPPHIRRAVIARDRHCAFAGCRQRPAACHVHHLIPRAKGGTTSVTNCVLLCGFHHLVVIHRWGWRLVLNADGTTTATSPDGNRTLHSHGPPRGQDPPAAA